MISFYLDVWNILVNVQFGQKNDSVNRNFVESGLDQASYCLSQRSLFPSWNLILINLVLKVNNRFNKFQFGKYILKILFDIPS